MRPRPGFAVSQELVRDVAVTVVTVTAEIDAPDATYMTALLRSLDGPLVLDLRDCGFMGSDGLRALLEGRRTAADRRQRLVLAVRPGGPVARLLDVAGVSTVFNVEATLEAARTAAGGWEPRVVADRRTLRAA